MSVEQSFVYGWCGQSGANPVSTQSVVSSDGDANRSITVGGGESVDDTLAWAADKLLGIYVNSPGHFTLVLNPGTTEEEEFTPTTGYPISWNALSGMYYPFQNAAVTGIRLISLQTDDQVVTIHAALDSASPTP